ncbi:MAG TPA: DUF2892 domain-containing protein [Alphaproteobacteria bacterium]|nr:DUF2892 domain-containing protein [Alphaproteobacteria bacterium]
MNFKANVGEKESLMRLIAGAVLLALSFLAASGSILQWLVLIAAMVLIATGIIRFCPIYSMMKKSTAESGK